MVYGEHRAFSRKARRAMSRAKPVDGVPDQVRKKRLARLRKELHDQLRAMTDEEFAAFMEPR